MCFFCGPYSCEWSKAKVIRLTRNTDVSILAVIAMIWFNTKGTDTHRNGHIARWSPLPTHVCLVILQWSHWHKCHASYRRPQAVICHESLTMQQLSQKASLLVPNLSLLWWTTSQNLLRFFTELQWLQLDKNRPEQNNSENHQRTWCIQDVTRILFFWLTMTMHWRNVSSRRKRVSSGVSGFTAAFPQITVQLSCILIVNQRGWCWAVLVTGAHQLWAVQRPGTLAPDSTRPPVLQTPSFPVLRQCAQHSSAIRMLWTWNTSHEVTSGEKLIRETLVQIR